jgi:hypothetical protein
MPGASSNQRGVGQARHLDLGLPHADGLDQDDVAAGALEHPDGLGRGRRQPAEMTPAGHGPDVDARVDRVVLHPDPVAQDRPAGERAGRVDREHADPLALAAVGAHQLVGQRGLAHAGRAGQPDDLGLAGVRGQRRGDLGQARVAVLDEADQPGDRPRVTLARGRDQACYVPAATR